MPVRRLNFTGRKRIAREDVAIALVQSEGAKTGFDASIDLHSYDLPQDALVSLEAYRQTSRRVFPFGTVAELQAPPYRSLEDFDSAEAVLFRVRVTDVGQKQGVLLAEADGIRPTASDEDDSDRHPLLPSQPADLGDQVWRVEIGSRPILLVNKKLLDWKEAIRSEQFRALVFPAAVREVLRHALSDGVRTSEDLSVWQGQWILFAKQIPGVSPVPVSQEDDETWLDEVATAFCRRFGFLARYQREFFGSRAAVVHAP